MTGITARALATKLSRDPKAGSYMCDACDAGPAVTVTEIERLIEHCLHDHFAPAGLLLVAYEVSLTPYELAFQLGLDARTEHEQKWRQSRVAMLEITPDSE